MVSFNGEKAMDNYKKLMCVKGLIFALQDEINRIDNLSDINIEKKGYDIKITVDSYYKTIVEFLNKEEK